MNLVQINERLKDLPMQVIQQYANGMNPEVPPYLALGELQRREIAQKQMANTQGAAQGPQPSIKEQVEQKAGLMAAQGLQQQQMMQQMAQPRGPMPAPAGIPQPQMQPQPAMMARGGLAGIPVRRDMFEYASGGIIAFAGGGEVDAARAELRRALETLRTYGSRQRLQDPEGFKAAEAAVAQAQERRKQLESSYAQEMALGGADRPATGMRDVGRVPALMQQEMPTPAAEPAGRRMSPPEVAKLLQDPYATGKPTAPAGAGLPDALAAAAGPKPAAPPAPPAPVAAPPMAAQKPAAPAGLPGAAQGQSPLMDEALAMAREKPAAPTAEGVIAEQQKLMPAGMQEDAMQKMFADQRGRAEGRRASYDKSKPSGLDDLIRVFGQAGQFKGLSGLAPAETALQQQRRSEDLAMEKQQDELLTAIEGRSTAADKELFGSREKSMTAATKAYQDRLLGNTKALADLAGVDQRRMDEAAGRLTQMQIAKLREATANKPTEAERIEANYMAMIAKGKPEEAEAYLNRISRIKGGGTAGVGADNAETRRLREAMKDVDSRLEFMSQDDPEYKQLQATRDTLSKRIVARAIGEANSVSSGEIDKTNPLLK